MVDVINFTKNKINKNAVIKLINFFLKSYKIRGDLSIVIMGDCRMKKINYKYRKKNKTTDVLSFPSLNEILISYPQIKRQAKKYKKTEVEEFNFILIHGLLHLCNFNDDTEAKRLKMIKLAENFLNDYVKNKK